MFRNSMIVVLLVIVASVGMIALGPANDLAYGRSSTNASGKKPSDCDNKGRILTLRPWYYGLTEDHDGGCRVVSIGSDPDRQRAFIWTVALNIVESLLQVVGYVAVGAIIYGGFIFMTSGGSPDKAASGRRMIINAAIGIAIAMSAVFLINFVVRNALGVAVR